MFDFSVIIDIGVVALRILLPLYAIFIVYQCYAAMRRRRRPEKPLVTLMNTRTFEKIPVLFWENSIGRKKSNDVVVEDAAVSKVHAVLLRRDEGWFINDTESLHGTFVNGRRTEGRTQVYIDDIIRVGNTDFQFLRGEEYNEELRSSWFFKNPSQKPAVKSWKLMLMITLFHFFMTVEAVYWNDGKNLLSPLIIFGIVAAVNWGMFIVSYFGLRRTTFELEALALFLSGIGTILLARQYERSAYMQVISTVVGFVIFCAIIKLIEDPDKLYRFRIPLMIAAVGLLGVSIVFGKVTNGAANWIYIGPLSFQPSELVKVIYILIGAGALDKLNTKKDLFIFIGFSVVCVGLLAVMRDLGTALIFFVTFLLIAFMRSGDFKTIILAVSAAVFGAIFAIRFMPYVADRFKAYRHVWEYAQAEVRRRHRQRLPQAGRRVRERPCFRTCCRGNGHHRRDNSGSGGSAARGLRARHHHKEPQHLLFYLRLLRGGSARGSAHPEHIRRNRPASAHGRNLPVHQRRRLERDRLLGTYRLYQGG